MKWDWADFWGRRPKEPEQPREEKEPERTRARKAPDARVMLVVVAVSSALAIAVWVVFRVVAFFTSFWEMAERAGQ